MGAMGAASSGPEWTSPSEVRAAVLVGDSIVWQTSSVVGNCWLFEALLGAMWDSPLEVRGCSVILAAAKVLADQQC